MLYDFNSIFSYKYIFKNLNGFIKFKFTREREKKNCFFSSPLPLIILNCFAVLCGNFHFFFFLKFLLFIVIKEFTILLRLSSEREREIIIKVFYF